MEIRAEKLEDFSAIHQVNIEAFQRTNEADLVDSLRKVANTFSFVALQDSKVVGHIFFSPVTVEGECPSDMFLLGLAPLAVLPEYQRQGIGSLLVKFGLRECEKAGCSAVFVLGNPQYYQRFGFITAPKRGLQCEYSVPDPYFMMLELKNGALQNCRGIVKYRVEFAQV